MSDAEQGRSDAVRTIRNQAAHPTIQQVMMPGPCISILPVIATAINELFEPGKATTPGSTPT